MNRNWHESYPYNAISCFALNPAYIRLEEVGILADKEAMKEFRKQQKALNKLPQVDYDAVITAKWDYLRRIFAQEGEHTLASPSYRQFYKENESWLRPYAAYCYLRDKYGTPDYTEWGDDAVYREELAEAEGPLCLFIQYHLHQQLKHAADYARDVEHKRLVQVMNYEAVAPVTHYKRDKESNPCDIRNKGYHVSVVCHDVPPFCSF
jgi:4-alpha-glucanotransferase